VKFLRQAFKWYHWHSDWDRLRANVSFLEFFSKYPQSLKGEWMDFPMLEIILVEIFVCQFEVQPIIA
jgi:hypothetical protein